MKKFVFVLALALSIGLLVSCEQGVQEVNIVNASNQYWYYYDLAGTISMYQGSTEAVDATPTIGSISWTKRPNTNYDLYQVRIEYTYEDENEETQESSVYLDITKVGGKYYEAFGSLDQKEITIDGDIESSSFSVTYSNKENMGTEENPFYYGADVQITFTRK